MKKEVILSAEKVWFGDFLYYEDIEIFKGETTFLCGESGCGKSTLLKLFNQTVSADSGELYYRGNRMEGIDTVSLRRSVLLASQNVFLFDGTIADNFVKFYEYREKPVVSRVEMQRCMDVCEVPFGPDAECVRMSGGERQRVFLAVCLSFGPDVLMLDEPTSALDKDTADRLISQVKAQCMEMGSTLVIVSHDRELAQTYADRIITLRRERV